jgi:hypothetical protein
VQRIDKDCYANTTKYTTIEVKEYFKIDPEMYIRGVIHALIKVLEDKYKHVHSDYSLGNKYILTIEHRETYKEGENCKAVEWLSNEINADVQAICSIYLK